jgi:hypothetical protein
MKKKTVITTEKHETWVIRGFGEVIEQGPDCNEPDPAISSLNAPLDAQSEPDSLPTEQN